MSTSAGSPRRLAILSGGLSALLGLLVLIGWHTRNAGLLQVHHEWIAMVYNTALLFVVAGLGLIATAFDRARVARACALAILALSLTVLAQYVLGGDLGVDRLFMNPFLTTATAHPGRMAPNTSLCFALVGAALLLLNRLDRPRVQGIGGGVVGSIVLGVSVNGLLGYVTGISIAYDWGRFVPMAVHTAAGLAVLGVGVVALAWGEGPDHAPRLLPFLIGVGLATLILLQWQALLTRERAQMGRVMEREAMHAGGEIRRQVRAQILALVRMAGRSEIGKGHERREWESDARSYVRDLPGIEVLEWTDPSTQSRWRVTPNRVGTTDSLERSLGRLERKSIPVDAVRAKPRLFLLGDAVLPRLGVVIPTLHRGVPASRIIAIFRVDRLLEEVLADISGRGLQVAVFDGTEPVYGRPEADATLDTMWGREEMIYLPGATWRVRIRPKAELLTGGRWRLPELTLAVGLLMAFALALMVHLAQTARRRAQEAEAAKEDRDRLFRLSNDMISVGGTDGYFKHVNPAFSRILGYTDQELLSRPYLEFVHPDDVRATSAEVESLASGNTTWAFENRCVCKDGSWRWFLWSATPDPQEKRFYAVAKDITERKLAEEALEESEEGVRLLNDALERTVDERTRQLMDEEKKFRALVENSSDAVALVDPKAKILYASPATTRILGYETEEFVGRTSFEFLHPDDLEIALPAMVRCLDSPDTPITLEHRLRHKDGSWRHMEGVAVNRLDDPAVGAIIVDLRDITERKRLEEQFHQAQRLEAVGRLAGGVSHDFNNMLAVIICYGESLLEVFPPENPHRESVEEILKAANRAADLTRQLLAFSRKQVVEPRVLDLNARVSELGKMLSRLLGEDIGVQTVLAPDLARIRIDPGQVEQIIMNLAVNARDAMPDGGTLTIATRNATLDASRGQGRFVVEPGPYVMLEARDTGTGMDAETQAQIFEPFFTTKEVGKGTGLGLATVYGIVKQNRGYVFVRSEPGRGATLEVYFPRVDDPIDQTNAASRSIAAGLGTETILLVEDDPAVRTLVRKTLETSGYTVLEARDPRDGLGIASEHSGDIHLMITDVIMPVMSGRTLADRLTERRPRMRVLYMSGYADEVVVHHGMLGSGICFLQKPFTHDGLRRKVREVLDGPERVGS